MQNSIEILNGLHVIITENDYEQKEFVVLMAKLPNKRPFIFELLTGDKFNIEWFQILFESNTFDFDTIPPPQSEIDKEGVERTWLTNWDASWILKSAFVYVRGNSESKFEIELIKFIDNYIDFVKDKKNKETPRNNRPDLFFSDYIFNLQLDKISDKHIEFIIEFGLNTSFSTVADDLTSTFFERVHNEKNKRLTQIILDLLFTPLPKEQKSAFRLDSKINNYYIRQFVDTSANKLYEILGNELFEWLNKKISILAKEYPFEFSKTNIIYVGKDDQDWSTDSLNRMIVDILRNCLQLENVEDNLKYRIIKEFLDGNIAILKRIGFYTIDIYYEKFSTLFWQLDNPLNEYESKLEIFKLIENHSVRFSREEVQLVTKWIEMLIVDSYEGEDEKTFPKRIAYKKLEWYNSLKNIREEFSSDVQSRMIELNQIAGVEPSHPGYDSWFETKSGGDFAERRITDEKIDEIVDRINNPEKWQGYDTWGLQEDLRNLVITKTNDVLNEINQFDKLEYNFLYYLFDGFRELSKSSNTLNWNVVIDFTERLIDERADIWEFERDSRHERAVALGSIAWFVRELSSSDYFNKNKEGLTRMSSIMIKVDNNYKEPFTYLNNDPSFDIINSTRGKIYEALLSISLTLAKYLEFESNKWEPGIQNHFTKRLYDESYLDEFYWTLGYYTPQISYLNKEWLEANKYKIYITMGNIENFSFRGYVQRSSRVYKDLFKILFEFYQHAIRGYNSYPNECRRLVEHIIIAFASKFENSNKLLDEIFENNNIVQIKELVDFLRFQLIQISPEDIILIWEKLISTLSQDSNSKKELILFHTSALIKYFSRPNEKVISLFSQALLRFENDPQNLEVLKSIDNIIKYDPHSGGELLSTIITKKDSDFNYGRDFLASLIQSLYKSGEADIANRICITLVDKQQFFARDIYNENSISA